MSELDALRRLSARIGADRMQIQGPGGNVSLKVGGRLFVKASGTRLAEAATRDILAELDRDAVLAAYRNGADVEVPEGAMRPSIETSFHAVIPHRVVLHTHSVAALAHLICPEGRGAALEKAGDLGAVLVPYAMPGRPLTAAIEAAGADAPVHLLANHGVIAGADDVGAAAALLAGLEERLALAARPSAGAGAAPEGWTRPGALHDPLARERAARGPYWPDAVVFLGAALGAGTDPVRLDGHGASIREDAPVGAHEMLQCLEDVLSRVPHGWTPEPLPGAEVAKLAGWEAEAFRRKRDGA
ncbi:MAG: class II aldolase/adducin family protein [Hasllibacter sp.]